ncbi:hypothetical protein GN330_21305 [Nitratireductor sp. CAU 1489]|uniref:Sulfatase N-terminal domain-containing protein n=1 Tax=Nitratireductor arenosus TaxID=2682096 RepID=A0A844QKH0_9HYPH|nr:hypothetical protein [Nitratireductor arenosus]MVA99795.1 hypothetical protein [Nitratireductor arenosus]
MTKERVFLMLAPALAFAAPVIAAFLDLSIPIFSGPALRFVGGVAAAGLGIGLILALVYRSGFVWSLIFTAVAASAFLILLDIAANASTWLHEYGSPVLTYVAFVMAMLPVAWAIWPLRNTLPTIMFMSAAAFLLSTVVIPVASGRPSPTTEIGSAEYPAPVLYFVLDEMIGPEGIDRSIPGGEEAYAALRDLFESHGFRLYGKVFSRFFKTADSIPASLAFEWTGNRVPNLTDPHRLFDKFVEDGHRVTVYQTEHLDFCSEQVDRCEVLPSFNPVSRYINHPGIMSAGIYEVMRQRFEGSAIIEGYVGYLKRTSSYVVPKNFDAHAFPSWMQKIGDDIVSGSVTSAVFGHILFPHAPFVSDANCRQNLRRESPYYLFEMRKLSGASRERARAAYYKDYFAQVQCMISRLGRFLERVKSAPGLEEAILVFHGDHGSRISAGKYTENVSDKDMVDNYSTLYAIKGPGIAPGYDLRKVSSQRLTAEYFSGKSTRELGREDMTVVIDSKAAAKTVLRQMPDF